MKVFLIAGHGNGDSGAVGGDFREADLTREIVALIPKYLSVYASVTVGDTGRDWFTWLKSNTFDFRPYDYVLEVHFNAGAEDSRGDGRRTGAEIYVTESEAAVSVEEAVLCKMEAVGLPNRGVKRKNFTVISAVKAQGVSSALLEVAFVDDKDDMELYQQKKEETAQAVSAGIAEGFGLIGEEAAMELKDEPEEKTVQLADDKVIYNYFDDNLPEWARATVQKLMEKGWLRGNEQGELRLTEDMLRIFTVNDRAGLYGN